MRRVWAVWALRKALPLAGLTLLIATGSMFISFSAVFSNAISSTRSVKSFVNYWQSAFVNTEVFVILGLIVFISGSYLFVRGIIRDLKTVDLRSDNLSY